MFSCEVENEDADNRIRDGARRGLVSKWGVEKNNSGGTKRSRTSMYRNTESSTKIQYLFSIKVAQRSHCPCIRASLLYNAFAVPHAHRSSRTTKMPTTLPRVSDSIFQVLKFFHHSALAHERAQIQCTYAGTNVCFLCLFLCHSSILHLLAELKKLHMNCFRPEPPAIPSL